MYAKLENNQLIYADIKKQIIQNGNWLVVDKTENELVSEGYKEIEYQEVEIPQEGYELIPSYSETANKITVDYTEQAIDNYWQDKATAEQAQQQAEQQRLGRLKMTKYDFFKYVVQPQGITYSQLETAININEDVRTAWDLCGHVYRGDTTLNNYISTIIPTITNEQLNSLFQTYGTSEYT